MLGHLLVVVLDLFFDFAAELLTVVVAELCIVGSFLCAHGYRATLRRSGRLHHKSGLG